MIEHLNRPQDYLTFIIFIEILTGAIIIIIILVYYKILIEYLAEEERRSLWGQLLIMIAFALQLIFGYSCGIWLWRQLWLMEANASGLKFIIIVWLFFTKLIIFNGFGALWCLYVCARETVEAAESSLLQGIDAYLSCPEWKLKWDSLQYNKQCCGVESYRNWQNASWMPEDESVRCHLRRPATGLAPHSCCKQGYTECLQAPNRIGLPVLKVWHINTEGCITSFEYDLWILIYILFALMLFVLKVHIVICFLFKIIVRRHFDDDSLECKPILEKSNAAYNFIEDDVEELWFQCSNLGQFADLRSSAGGFVNCRCDHR